MDKTYIENEAFLLIYKRGEIWYQLEFSKALSKTRWNKHLCDEFTNVLVTRGKGVLSDSVKNLYTISINEKSPEDILILSCLNQYLRKGNYDVWFINSKEEVKNDNWEDWFEHTKTMFTTPPEPKTLNYKLPVNAYGNVNACDDMPYGWHMTELTVSQLKKLEIPYYKACVDFVYSWSSRYPSKPVLKNIIPDDFQSIEDAFLKEKEEKEKKSDEQINKLELTPKLVAECIYSINKEAKRKRDIQSNCRESAYGWRRSYPSVHYHLHQAKDQKEALYHLKNEALTTAIKVWNLTPVGYHEFGDMSRDMYVLEGYEFHTNENISNKCLGKIEEEIDATRKRSVTPERARKILYRFIEENK